MMINLLCRLTENGEINNIPDVYCARHQHDQSINVNGYSRKGRHSIFQGSQKIIVLCRHPLITVCALPRLKRLLGFVFQWIGQPAEALSKFESIDVQLKMFPALRLVVLFVSEQAFLRWKINQKCGLN